MEKIRLLRTKLKDSHEAIHDYFSNNQDEIRRLNFVNLRRFAYIFLICHTVFLCTFWSKLVNTGNQFFSVGMVVLQLGFAIFTSTLEKDEGISYSLVHLLCVLQLVIVHVTLLWMNIASVVSYTTSYYPLIYLITSVLFIMKAREIFTICVTSSVSLILLSWFFSSPDLFAYDLMAAIGSLVIALILYAFIAELRVRNWKMTEKLRLMSSIDGLTEIYNKTMTEYLCRAYYGNGNKRRPVRSALLVIDIDSFKEINDSYGHVEGDRVLSAFGKILHELFREDDVVGRVGGDEFVVLIKNTSDWTTVRLKAEKIEEKIRKIPLFEGANAYLTCSIGIALSPHHGNSYEELFSKADQAMYRTKKERKGRYRLYTERPELEGHPVILAVDDAEVAISLLQKIFGDRYTVLTAKNGKEAMMQLHQYHDYIEVVILDLIMPVMDGYAVLDEMTSDPALRAIPVMVTTADQTEELHALQMGAVDLVFKPFDPDVLIHRVDNLVHRGQEH